jgi:putative phosphoesterase
MLLGVISDTHGLLRPEAVEALRGAQHVIHAGDVGSPEILKKLATIAPVTAVRGNVDKEPWAQQLPETQVLETGGISIYLVHDLTQLDVKPEAAGFSRRHFRTQPYPQAGSPQWSPIFQSRQRRSPPL